MTNFDFDPNRLRHDTRDDGGAAVNSNRGDGSVIEDFPVYSEPMKPQSNKIGAQASENPYN